jgi:predicted RNase H-like HicB family nuclease
MKSKRKFTVVIERDEEGYFVATVPALRGCHTQAKTLDTLMKRVREVIKLCIDDGDESNGALELVGIQQISIWPACPVSRASNSFGRLNAPALQSTGHAEAMCSSSTLTEGPLLFLFMHAKRSDLGCFVQFFAMSKWPPNS